MELNPKQRMSGIDGNFKKAIKMGVIQQLYKDEDLTDMQYKKLIHKNGSNREIHSI